MENRSDAQLITDYFEGKREALEVLISRYLKPVYGFIFNFVKDAGVAEDLTQEVFIKAWRRLKKFDRKKALSRGFLKSPETRPLIFCARKRRFLFRNLITRMERISYWKPLKIQCHCREKFLTAKIWPVSWKRP